MPATVAVFFVGAFGFALTPALTTRVFSESEQAPTLASSLNVSAFNAGITAGPWLGGLALGAVSVRREKALVP